MVATSNLHQCWGIDGVDRCSIHGGLTADLALEDVPNPLWERAGPRWSLTITRVA
jgi:hypothetical protein